MRLADTTIRVIERAIDTAKPGQFVVLTVLEDAEPMVSIHDNLQAKAIELPSNKPSTKEGS